jgi:cysteinyl-tRNA synthetase
MALAIFNTLSEKKEEVKLRSGNEFRMFVCGPTVQENVHLGHAKTYIAFDVLARWLRSKGLKVNFLLNVTDIDDKIFDRARNENVPYTEISDRFFKDFVSDMNALNIKSISRIEPVSNYIEKSIELARDLVSKDIAYALDGNTYFDTAKADRFGKLSHQTPFELKIKQVDAAPGKRNGVDFLLWRKIEDTDEGVWESSLGPGRPGWHIQDSAIAFSVFGAPYDLHGGATELIFPHHESELAQDEALSGTVPFVSIWMHTGLLLKNHEKMSKSLGNVVKIRDALEIANSDTIRAYFLKHHYRSSFDLDMKALSACDRELTPIRGAAKILSRDSQKEIKLADSEELAEFSRALDDDLNTPKALEILIDLSRKMIEESSAPESSKSKAPSPFWFMVESLGFSLA